MVAVLQPLNDGNYIAIDRAVVLVGRAADCDAVITHSKKISRKHCCLIQVDETFYVRDLGSMNGVWLNGDRVNRESLINLGDHLSIGDVEFRFHPNAKIEDRKSTEAAAGEAAPAESFEVLEAVVLDDSDASDDVVPLEAVLLDDSSPAEDEVEIVDDLVPLDANLNLTNEVEAVDPSIADEDLPVLNFDDSDDEVTLFEDKS